MATELRRAELEGRNQRRRIEISPIRVTYIDLDEDMFSSFSAFSFSAFAEHILREPIPSKNWPPLDHYKYFSDPVVHVASFEDITSLYNISNAVKCRLFLTTLKGLSRRSFSSLPDGSINSFEDFASQFISHFSSAKPLFKSPDRNRGGRSCGELTKPWRAVKLKERIEGSPAKTTFPAQDFGPSAFAPHILREPIPSNLKQPWLDHYTGSSDPKEHVIAFEDLISLYNISHAVKCRFFLMTLRESARRWFSTLPEGSIKSFRDFASQFISRFLSGGKRMLKSPMTLFSIKQGENESLKNYMTRFTRASFEVADVEREVVRVALTMGICDEPFKFSLALNPQATMDDLLNKIQKFIKGEEILFS